MNNKELSKLNLFDTNELIEKSSSSCNPTLIKGSMMYSPTEYLHCFEGKYFIISDTPNGGDTKEVPCHKMDSLMTLYKEINNDTDIEDFCNFIFVLSALTTAYKCFDKTLLYLSNVSNKMIFNDFLSLSADKDEYATINADLSCVFSNLYRFSSSYEPNFYTSRGFHILLNTDSVLSLNRSSISLSWRHDKKYTTRILDIPSYIYCNRGIMSSEKIIDLYSLFVEFLLTFCGIKVDWNNMHNMIDRDKYEPNLVYSAKNLSDIRNYIKKFIYSK